MTLGDTGKTINNKECQRYFGTENTYWPWIFQTANQTKFLDSSYLIRLSILLLVSWSLYSKDKKEVFYSRNRKFYIDSLVYIRTCTWYMYFSFSALWRGLRDRPLEKLWGGGGEFSSRRNFFSLSNSLYEFFLGHSMNIF